MCCLKIIFGYQKFLKIIFFLIDSLSKFKTLINFHLDILSGKFFIKKFLKFFLLYYIFLILFVFKYLTAFKKKELS